MLKDVYICSRLRQLVNLNLVKKIEMSERRKGVDCSPVYITTLFGNLIYKRSVLDMEEMLGNTSTLKAAEILYHSSKFSPEEIVRFMSRYM